MSASTDGFLLVRPSAKATASGFAYYAKWRDADRVQVKRLLGPAWVEPHGDGWRKRRNTCPEGYLVPHEAVARMREVIAEHALRAGVAPRRSRAGELTFAELAEEWHLHGATVGDWKPSTIRNYGSQLKVHLLPAFGRRRAAEISNQDVRWWWRALHDPRRKGGPMSNRNANAVLSTLRVIFNWAVAESMLAANPAVGIRKHREAPADKAPFYTPDEVLALTRTAELLHGECAADPNRRERACASRHDAAIFLVAAFTGLRRGELVSLRWRNVDFARRSIYVVENLSAGQDARVKDHEGRTVPLATAVATTLARARPGEPAPDELVFPSTGQRKLDPDALSSRFRNARDAAGLRPLRFHDLRHTFGSLAVDGGASLVQVKEWMGHSDVKTTMRYLHTKSRRRDAELLDSAFAYDAVALTVADHAGDAMA
jgi:integrase